MKILSYELESDCTLISGFEAFIKSVSYSEQSNLFLHFLSTSKRFSRSSTFLQCLEMAEDCFLCPFTRLLLRNVGFYRSFLPFYVNIFECAQIGN